MFIVCLRFSFDQSKLRVRSNRMLMHLIVLFSHFYMKNENVLSDTVAEITELGEAELLHSLILITVVPGISVVVRSLDHF